MIDLLLPIFSVFTPLDELKLQPLLTKVRPNLMKWLISCRIRWGRWSTSRSTWAFETEFIGISTSRRILGSSLGHFSKPWFWWLWSLGRWCIWNGFSRFEGSSKCTYMWDERLAETFQILKNSYYEFS